ncbi:hypothetical protein B0H67DRAFT_649017 [Lasiosphaeris hirsuta]|uniref:Peptidase S8/S53 domain-containing protein n=1 Tax=Lasiosphaeris hirsuta TaxID=260670 RepID=A0AA40DKX9_9PEZI|nr:hypothetical protein B0H67DRAFT_649017 [Lasiosphaeris hirsuta]
MTYPRSFPSSLTRNSSSLSSRSSSDSSPKPGVEDFSIISLSFAFASIDQSLEPIRLAILQAHAAGVTVFAAAGYTIRSRLVAFTARFVPTVGPGKRLCATGEAIEATWICETPGKKGHTAMVRRAGTSYATPVAAGVAAVVMDFCVGRPQGPGSQQRQQQQQQQRRLV